jgi:uncharacterized protein (DUF885 family)
MTTTRRALLLAAAAAAAVPAASAQAAGTPDGQLQALFDETASDLLESLPETATLMGLDRDRYAAVKFKLNDRSATERARFVAVSAERRRRLKGIDRNAVPGVRGAVYDTLDYWYEENANQGRFAYWDQMAGQISPYVLSQITGAYQSVPDFLDSQHVVAGKSDAEAYLSRLQAFAVCLDQETDRFRQAAAQGVIPPDFLLDVAIAQISELRATPAEKSTLVGSLDRRVRELNIPGDWHAQACEARRAGDRACAGPPDRRPEGGAPEGVARAERPAAAGRRGLLR